MNQDPSWQSPEPSRPPWARGWALLMLGLVGAAIVAALVVPSVSMGLPLVAPLMVVALVLSGSTLANRYRRREEVAPPPRPPDLAGQPPAAQLMASSAWAEQETRSRAVTRIEAVRQDYSAKLGDIAYVIEHQGMFDLTHAPARELTSWFAQVQDTDLGRAPVVELRDLAGNLDAAWQAAIQYAERLGYSALRGDQDEARQAAGLARKAASASVTGPEKDALLGRLRVIMATLDVVMPRPLAGQLASPLIAELPSRPPSDPGWQG